MWGIRWRGKKGDKEDEEEDGVPNGRPRSPKADSEVVSSSQSHESQLAHRTVYHPDLDNPNDTRPTPEMTRLTLNPSSEGKDTPGEGTSEKSPLVVRSVYLCKHPNKGHSWVYISAGKMNRTLVFIMSGVMLLIAIGLLVTLFHFSQTEEYELPYVKSPSKLGIYASAAISVDAYECAEIGKEILSSHENATAADAGIAVLFCMGLIIPESMGIGGGAIITYFDASKQETVVINARETAPSTVSENMYNDTSKLATRGRGAIATPGELKGYYAAYERYSNKAHTWEQLIQPTIALAKRGFPVGKHLDNAIASKWKGMDPHLKELFTNPDTDNMYKEGNLFKRPDLAATLEIVAKEGVNSLYTREGSLIKSLLQDLEIIYPINNPKLQGPNLNDFINYEPEIYPAAKYRFPSTPKYPNLTLYAPDPSCSGPVLGFIISSVLSSYNQFSKGETLDPFSKMEVSKFFFKTIEAFKYAYSSRQFLGDIDFENDVTKNVVAELRNESFAQLISGLINKRQTTMKNLNDYNIFADVTGVRTFVDDHGTSALVVVDHHGNAFSVGSTINAYFGSQVVSPKTGIMMNNEMDDFNNGFINSFGVRPTTNFNKVLPKKRPLSSMAPAILTTQSRDQKEQVLMAIGGSGGTQITTSVAYVILRCLLFGEDIKTAIDGVRFHHQLLPNDVKYEMEMPNWILKDLKTKYKHEANQIVGRGSVVMAILRDKNGNLAANSDYRKGGTVDGF